MHEPRLLSTEPSHYILEPQQPYHYRFRAVDDVKTLGMMFLSIIRPGTLGTLSMKLQLDWRAGSNRPVHVQWFPHYFFLKNK